MARGLAQYRLLQGLYRGGQADVYLALDQRSERRVCIKIYHLQGGVAARRRVEAEAWKLARVASPRVVHVLDVVGHGDELALVTRYVPGVDLESLLRDRGSLAFEDGLSVAADIAAALAALRQEQLTHGDLSPRNVFLDRQGRATLGDFGVAVQRGHDLAGFSTHALSPEQLRGEAADLRSDFFCLGLLLYRAITGEHPFFDDGELNEARLQRGLREPPRLPGLALPLADALSSLLCDLLAADPARRPQSTVSLRERLRQLRVRLPPSTQLGEQVAELQRRLPAPELPLRLPRRLVTLPLAHQTRDWMRGYWNRGSIGARLLVLLGALGLPALLFAWGQRPGPCVAVAEIDLRLPRLQGASLPPESELTTRLVRLAKAERPEAMVIGAAANSDSIWVLSRHGLRDRCVAQRILALTFDCEEESCDLVLDARGPRGNQQLRMPYVEGLGEQRFLSELRRRVAEQMAFLLD